jgi:hypothetical protein
MRHPPYIIQRVTTLTNINQRLPVGVRAAFATTETFRAEHIRELRDWTGDDFAGLIVLSSSAIAGIVIVVLRGHDSGA